MTTMDTKTPVCECHELRRVKSYPPDPAHSDFSSELQSASTLTTLTEVPAPAPPSFLDRVQHLRSLFYLLAFSSTFTILNCLFVFFVLIRGHVESPGVIWDATKTNVHSFSTSWVEVVD